MRRILLLLLLIPVLVLSKDKQANEPIMFRTDVACFEHQGLLEILKNKFGEDPVFVAKSDQVDAVTMVLINQQSGTYSIITTNKVMACILDVGNSVIYRLPKMVQSKIM